MRFLLSLSRVTRVVACALALAAMAVQAQSPSDPTPESKRLFGEIEGIMAGLSEITGWKIKHKVPADYISKDSLRTFVEKRMKETVKPEEVRIEALTLKMFGLIPEDFDMEKATVDLVTEQAAAFYDYNKKRLFVTESEGTFIEKRIVLIHELAHALADQQFSLARYIRKGGKSDDSATAREAVMEGQATWLMWAYSQKLSGGAARPTESLIATMKNSGSGGGGAQFPVFESSPLYMRETLVFPYNQGTVFQDAVFDKLAKSGFSEVFRRAPASSSEILHPELYFRHGTPLVLRLPEIPEHKAYRTVAEGSVGELDHHILVEQSSSKEDADGVSPHWRAGSFRLYERKADKQAVLTYLSEWDSAESAGEWARAFRNILSKRNRSGDFTVEQEGSRVSARVTRPAASKLN